LSGVAPQRKIEENRPTVSGDPDPVVSVEDLLSWARAGLERLTPAEALAESEDGAALVDIRPTEQRERDGTLPGAVVISRNVLEWRLDPRGEHRDDDLGRPGRRVILICNEGYQSSLAAATVRRFGVDATDVVGGVQSWLADGLPTGRPAAR
jgi:rhodanese-related sulfurtransferase